MALLRLTFIRLRPGTNALIGERELRGSPVVRGRGGAAARGHRVRCASPWLVSWRGGKAPPWPVVPPVMSTSRFQRVVTPYFQRYHLKNEFMRLAGIRAGPIGWYDLCGPCRSCRSRAVAGTARHGHGVTAGTGFTTGTEFTAGAGSPRTQAAREAAQVDVQPAHEPRVDAREAGASRGDGVHATNDSEAETRRGAPPPGTHGRPDVGTEVGTDALGVGRAVPPPAAVRSLSTAATSLATSPGATASPSTRALAW